MTDIAATDSTTDALTPWPDAADEVVMSMLQGHLPLSLLCDLSTPQGPPSSDILAEEGEPETRWWEQ